MTLSSAGQKSPIVDDKRPYAPRMPPDRPLTEADIELVERWILNGACRNGLACNGACTDGGGGN